MTVNHLVAGSNPASGAIHNKPPKTRTLNDLDILKDDFITTLLQQKYEYKNYINSNKEYLQILNNRYYFVIRIKKKIFKASLKTNRLKYANIIKLNILKWLDKMEFNRNLQVEFLVEENDNPEEAKRIIKKLEQVLLKEKQKSNKIEKITTATKHEKNYDTIEDVFNNFIEYSRKVKKVKENTFKEYKTSFKYLFLFYKKKTKVYELEDIEKFIEYRDFLTTLPNTFLRLYKDNLDIDDILYKILEDNEKNDIETILLNTKTINKHFITYSQFLDYLVLFKKIKSNPIKGLAKLITVENPYNSYTDEEIIKLYKNTTDKEIKYFFDVLLHTGMRLSSVLNIKKENIDISKKTLKIEDDKTLSGKRTIIIHNKIVKVFIDYVKDDRKYLFFHTNQKDIIQKRINKHIKKILEVNKTIHSFRKNFTQKLFPICKDINIRKYIIGHSQLKDLTFTTYNEEKVDMKEISYIINSIDYAGNDKIEQTIDLF